MSGLVALAPIAAGAVVAGALLPWRGRAVVRAVLLFALLLSPPIAAGVLIAVYGRSTLGTWLLFVPFTFAWLATIDWKCGIGARLARPPRAKPRSNGASAASQQDR